VNRHWRRNWSSDSFGWNHFQCFGTNIFTLFCSNTMSEVT
jgi:hypothetical protein